MPHISEGNKGAKWKLRKRKGGIENVVVVEKSKKRINEAKPRAEEWKNKKRIANNGSEEGERIEKEVNDVSEKNVLAVLLDLG